MSVLEHLARTHFPHLSVQEGRAAVVRLLDALDTGTLRQARFEQHHAGRVPGSIRETDARPGR